VNAKRQSPPISLDIPATLGASLPTSMSSRKVVVPTVGFWSITISFLHATLDLSIRDEIFHTIGMSLKVGAG